MESDGDLDMTRDTYERAIANVPPSHIKRHWRRYIYLWINYALYEELEAKDYDRARQVYEACLQIIPHKKFTFAKIWLLFSQFELRQKNLTQARKILVRIVIHVYTYYIHDILLFLALLYTMYYSYSQVCDCWGVTVNIFLVSTPVYSSVLIKTTFIL